MYGGVPHGFCLFAFLHSLRLLPHYIPCVATMR
jgi:hypothetical protein